MKKHFILTSLVAIVATGAAHADEISTNVNFAGNYTLGEATHSVNDKIGTLYPDANYEYDYTGYIYDSETRKYKSETETTNLADNVAADHFKYTSYDDETKSYTVNQTYESGKEDKFQAEKNWLATTDNEDKGMVSVTDQVLNGNNGSLGTFKYTYNGHTSTLAVDEEGNFVAMDTTNLSGNVDLAGASVAGLTLETPESVSVTAKSGTESTISGLSADSYVYETANGSRYVLNATAGTASYDSESGEYSYTGTITMTDPDGFPQVIPDNPSTDAEKAAAAAYNALKDAFVQDTYNTQQKVAELQTTYAEEEKAYAAAKLAYTNDEAILNNLSDAYTTYTNAGTAYANATAADLASKVKAEGKRNADIAYHNAAQKYYNTPIATTIDGAIEASVENGSVKTALDTKADKTALDTKADADKVYTKAAADERFASVGTVATNTNNIADLQDSISTLTGDASVVGSVDNKVAATTGKIHGLVGYDAEGELQLNGSGTTATTRLDSNGHYNGNLAIGTTIEDHLISLDNGIGAEAAARSNADQQLANQINDVANGLRSDFAAADALTLRSANAYTDDKVNKLEKDMSGGVAAATALSAVSVGNVDRGEVSVGGGYGYYNGQSAMAFGAAMGLSEGWSINAGAGIAQGDKTQFSIRAGTNYKFKLF